MRVARAAPNTPSPSPATIQRSINIFNIDENIKRANGIFDSPIEVNIVERILYINKMEIPQNKLLDTIPLHSVYQQVFVIHSSSNEKNKTKDTQNILKTRKLINDVDTIVSFCHNL